MKKKEAYEIFKSELNFEGYSWKKYKEDFQGIYLEKSTEFKLIILRLFMDRARGSLTTGYAFTGHVSLQEINKLKIGFLSTHPLIRIFETSLRFPGKEPWDMKGYELDGAEKQRKRVELLKGMNECETEEDLLRSINFYRKSISELIARIEQINNDAQYYTYIENSDESRLTNIAANYTYLISLRLFLRAKLGAPDFQSMYDYSLRFFKHQVDMGIHTDHNRQEIIYLTSVRPTLEEMHKVAISEKKYKDFSFRDYTNRIQKPPSWQ